MGALESAEQLVSITSETQFNLYVVATTYGLENDEDLSIPTKCGLEPALKLDVQIPNDTEMWLWEVTDWSLGRINGILLFVYGTNLVCIPLFGLV